MATTSTSVDLSENRGPEVNVIAWLFTGIAIATVFLKLIARIQRLGWDDFFIFFSLMLSIIAAAFVSYSVTLGLGRRTAAVLAEHGAERLVLTAKWQILGYPFNIGSFSFPNISIAILVNNLLDPNPFRSRCLFGMAIMQVVFAMISVVIIFKQCTPTRALWDSTVVGKCWSPNIFNDYSYWVSAYTTLTDIVLAVVPISIFWKLQMQFKTKIGVCIMMGLTLLSAVVTIIKATYLHLFTDRTDPLFNVVPLVIWGLIEQNVVIVAACIPTLRPFFNKAFRSRSSRSATDGSHNNSKPEIKLSSRGGSKAMHSNSKSPSSVSELPLDKPREAYDTESHNSRQGIWRTTEFEIESDEEKDMGNDRSRERKMRDMRVPESLRSGL